MSAPPWFTIRDVLIWLALIVVLELVYQWQLRRHKRAQQVQRVRERLQQWPPRYKVHVQLASGPGQQVVTMWSHVPLQSGDVVGACADGTVGPVGMPPMKALGVVVWSRG